MKIAQSKIISYWWFQYRPFIPKFQEKRQMEKDTFSTGKC